MGKKKLVSIQMQAPGSKLQNPGKPLEVPPQSMLEVEVRRLTLQTGGRRMPTSSFSCSALEIDMSLEVPGLEVVGRRLTLQTRGRRS